MPPPPSPGNRDLNKMRWTSQLAFRPGSYKKKTGHVQWLEWNTLERVDGPCWVKDDAKRANMSPMAYYRKMIAKENGVNPDDVSDMELHQYDTVANRIRWHFKVTRAERCHRTREPPLELDLSWPTCHTSLTRARATRRSQERVVACAHAGQEMMGADGEFERRQAELTHLNALKDAEADMPKRPRKKSVSCAPKSVTSCRNLLAPGAILGSATNRMGGLANEEDVVWSTVDSVGAQGSHPMGPPTLTSHGTPWDPTLTPRWTPPIARSRPRDHTSPSLPRHSVPSAH
jgi:hypothetical protein